MAFRKGERNQVSFLPPSIDEYVAPEDPVRAYDVFVDQLDFGDLGISLETDQSGPPAFDPRAMLKLLVYGYSYGYRSSRKLERSTHHNLSFIWLMGGLRPDFKTIARFRRDHRKGLKKVLKQCARICLKLGLIEGNTLFSDGTKMRANASLDKSFTEQKARKLLKKIDERIAGILAKSEAVDDLEDGKPSLVEMQKNLRDNEQLRSRVRETLKELEEGEKKSINMTDPDCNRMKGRDGLHAGYNVQSVVDDKNGLIVHSDAVSDNNDRKQFGKQISAANETLAGTCKTACADAGYANTKELKSVADEQIEVIVPSEEQLKKRGPYDKEHFTYDKKGDEYVCPKGEVLIRRSTYEKKGQIRYTVKSPATCRRCPAFGKCTSSKYGRSIIRLKDEEFKKSLERHFEKPESQVVFCRRKSRCEHPFGHIKWNRGARSFLLRGLLGVRAEASLMFVGFNLTRMISILGVSGLVRQLKTA